ncbi:MAG: T9SS type A sorting domain-containing protein [Bacteroidota bacterium]
MKQQQITFFLFCILFFCFGQTNGQTFYMTAGQTGSDEGATCIIPADIDGQFFVASYRDSNAVVLKMDRSGHFLWQQEFDFSAPPLVDRIHDLMVDGHYLVGCGISSGSLTENRAFVFKYDLQQDAMVWQWLATEASRAAQVIKHPVSGDYLICGSKYSMNGTTADGWMTEIDQTTGSALGFNASYSLPGLVNFNNTVVHGDYIYTAYRFSQSPAAFDFRGSVAKFNLATKAQEWTYQYVRSATDSAQLYAGDLTIENDTIFVVHHGSYDFADVPVSQLWLTASDLDGNLYWTKNYDIQGMIADWSQELVATADGFLILGNDRSNAGIGRDIFLMKVDRQGNFKWAKRYGDPNSVETMDLLTHSQLLVNGDHLYFTAVVDGLNGPDEDLLIVKANLNGEVTTGQCPISDLVVTSASVTDVRDAAVLVQGDSVPHVPTTPDFSASSLQSSLVCGTQVSLAPEVAENSLVAYPNPTNGMLHLRYSLQEAQGMVLDVRNLMGQMVSERILEQNMGTLELDFHGQSTGMYLLTVKDGGGKTIWSEKVIYR